MGAKGKCCSFVVGATVFCIGLAGCVDKQTPVIQPPAEDPYIKLARTAQRDGNWREAARYWRRVILDSAFGPQLALANYEQGRALGVLCDYDEARKALEAAYSIDLDTKGPAYMALFELGRLSFARKRYQEAAEFYRRGFPLAEKAGALKAAPLDTALLWEEYSLALERIGDQTESQRASKNGEVLRLANMDGRLYADLTPYGTQCSR
jgi:tetratricopeptide (TPR) repeat protein